MDTTEIEQQAIMPSAVDAPPTLAPFEIDVERYGPMLGEVDMTEAQKHELLVTLWSIMRSFVDLGFSSDACGHMLAHVAQASNPQIDSVELLPNPKLEEQSHDAGKA